MMSISIRHVVWVMLVWLSIAGASSAEERAARESREARRFNTSFAVGSTRFNDSDPHQTLGVSFRFRLTERLSVEPEFTYMRVPRRTYTWDGGRSETKHSDLRAVAFLVYDFRAERIARVIPYVSGGAGWLQVRDEIRMSRRGSVPSTSKSASDTLWAGAAFGVRILLGRGVFLSPELGFGATKFLELTPSAALRVGYGF